MTFNVQSIYNILPDIYDKSAGAIRSLLYTAYPKNDHRHYDKCKKKNI